MERHGPWLPGRLRQEFPSGDAPAISGLSAPVCRYLRHLKNADGMIGMLRDGLREAGRSGILELYGDRLPNLPDLITEDGNGPLHRVADGGYRRPRKIRFPQGYHPRGHGRLYSCCHEEYGITGPPGSLRHPGHLTKADLLKLPGNTGT